MLRIILIILTIAVLYKLIFGFIIPVYRTTREMKKRFRDINQQMEDRMNQFNGGQGQFRQTQTQQSGQAQSQKPSGKKPSSGKDYIEFEEVK